MDRPYDPNEQASRGEREEPVDFSHYEEEDASGGGPSTMDGESQSEPTQLIVSSTQAVRSPLIPRPIDNTALDAFMSCPQKYEYSMVENRRASGSGKPALAYGTCWHAIMEAHYKTGGDMDKVIEAALRAWKPHDSPEDHRTIERCLTEYGKFLENYGTFEQEVQTFGQTIGYPHEPMVEIPVEVWWPGANHPYAGKIDRIYEHHGLYYVEDHKTTTAMGPTYFKQFDPSNQMMGYAVLAQELIGQPIAGVRINAHAVLKTTSKFARQTILFSPDRLEEWKENYNYWISRIEFEYNLKNHGNPSAFPMNLNACAGKYGMCQFTDVCTFDRVSRPRILETMGENPWNPLNPTEDDE